MDLNVGIEYDSKMWKIDEYYDETGFYSNYTWKYEDVWPQVALGWRLTVPFIVAHSTVSGDSNEFCFGSTIITLGNGAKYAFNNRVGCPNSIEGYSQLVTVVDADEMISARLDGTNPSDIKLFLKDGTTVHFPSYYSLANRIVDRNGNQITINTDPQSPNRVSSIIDSVGREATFNYTQVGNATELTSISYSDSAAHRRLVQFSYTALPVTPKFNFPEEVPWCGYNPVDGYPKCENEAYVTQYNGAPTSRLLASVTLTGDATGDKAQTFSFQYDDGNTNPAVPNFVELTRITYPTVGFTTYGFQEYTHLWGTHAERLNNHTTVASFREVVARNRCTVESDCSLTGYSPSIGQVWPSNSGMTVRFHVDANTSFDSVYTFDPGTAPGEQRESYSPRELSRTTYHSGGTGPYTKTETTYTTKLAGCPERWSFPETITTTLRGTSGDFVSKTTTTFDDITSRFIPYDPLNPMPAAVDRNCYIDNPLSTTEYLFNSTTPFRQTVRTWHKETNYLNAHLLGLKASERISDGAGNKVAETFYVHDSVQPSQNVPSDARTFDATVVPLGNLNEVRRWLNTTNSNVPTFTTYDRPGNILTVKDPLNHTTTYTYGDGLYCGSAGGYAFKTSATAKNFTSYFEYNGCTGALKRTWGPNQNDEQSFEYDLFGRLKSANLPANGHVETDYDDTNRIVTTAVRRTDSGSLKYTREFYDPLGRSYQTELCEDGTAGCSEAIRTVTTLDGLNRTKTVTNPYRGTTSSPVTTNSYDGENHLIRIDFTDGSVSSTSYDGNRQEIVDEAGKRRTLYSDAAGRLSQVDEIGTVVVPGTPGHGTVTISGEELFNCDDGPCIYDSGMVSVTVNGFSRSFAYSRYNTGIVNGLVAAFNSAPSSPVTAVASGWTITFTSKASGASTNYSISASSFSNYDNLFSPPSFTASTTAFTGGTDGSGSENTFVTLYEYDALNNLKRVEQRGNNQAQARIRTFVYDSLSQLLSATSPEYGPSNSASGTITYEYYSDGTLKSKTDARNVTVSYCYDELHRPLGKKYSNSVDCTSPSTWDIEYRYDVADSSLPDPHPVFTRTFMRDASGTTAWSHDAAGRVKIEKRTINGVTRQITYSYNPDGSVSAIDYGTAPANVLTLGYDLAGRPNLLQRNGVDIARVQSNSDYAPHGEITNLKLGTNLLVQKAFNSRLQPAVISSTRISPPATVMSLSYDHHDGSNNGNIYQVRNDLDSNRTQNYAYDGFNRLVSYWTAGSSAGNNYSVDAWGNLYQKTPYFGKTNYWPLSETPNVKNRFGAHTYDNAGNMTDGQYSYDAESQLASAGSLAFTYDGDGKRVKKSNGTLYWTGIGSDPLFETSLDGVTVKDTYLYFAGKRVAKVENGNTYFYLTDHLGTTRKVAQADGTICLDEDFYPYGEQQQTYTATCSEKYLFTGKERDSETGLDYFGARYYGSNMGRWMSPDWAGAPEPVPYADFGDPQTLNLYGYVRNNPLSHADADGHCCEAEWSFFKQELAGVWDTTGGAAVGAVSQLASGQAADNVRDTYFSGNVGGNLAAAGSEFVSQSVNMVESAAAGDPRAIGQIAGIVISGKAASELKGAGSTETVQRAMSEGELQATRDTGLIRGGRGGTNYVSDSISKDANRAQQRLALPQKPQVRATMEVQKGKFGAPSRVKPANNMPGGGMERTAKGKIPVKIKRVDEMK
ncbi:MAG TPA: RHS repeat-associated core domain-containing protein [Clostridia bacterium]|nr:RHS repeat-associated core domain-containing protein [Clostridia bacterium]